MPAVETTSDIEILEALDFEPTPTCEVKQTDGSFCGKPAAWYVTCRTCRVTVPFCGDCLGRLQRIVPKAAGVMCPCGAASSTLEGLASVVPIGGGS